MQKLLTMSEVAALTRQPLETLRYWRAQGRGPEGHKVGRRVLYAESDVERWITDQMKSTA